MIRFHIVLRPLLLFLAFWQVGIILFGPPPGAWAWIGQGALLLYLPLAFLAARPATRILIGLLLAGITITVALTGRTGTVLPSLNDGLTFAAFMPVIQVIRAGANALPFVQRARSHFQALDRSAGETGIFLGAYGMGLVLTTAAHAITAPLLPDNASDAQRRRGALLSLRGVALGAMWSPFFVAVGFGTHHLPDLPAWRIVATGFGLSALCLVLALAMERMRPSSIPLALRGLLPVLPPVAVAAAVMVAVTLVTPLSTLNAVTIAMPPLMLAGVALTALRQFWPVIRESYDGLARLADEVALIAVALILGRLLEATPEITAFLAPLLIGWPGPALLALCMLGLIGGGIIGLHPVVSAALMMALLSGLPNAPSDALLIQAVVFAWGLATMLSPSGITLIVAALVFRVSPLRLSWSRNLFFALGCCALATLVLGLMQRAGV